MFNIRPDFIRYSYVSTIVSSDRARWLFHFDYDSTQNSFCNESIHRKKNANIGIPAAQPNFVVSFSIFSLQKLSLSISWHVSLSLFNAAKSKAFGTQLELPVNAGLPMYKLWVSLFENAEK